MSLRGEIIAAIHERWCGSPPSCGNKPDKPCGECPVDIDEVTAIVKAVVEWHKRQVASMDAKAGGRGYRVTASGQVEVDPGVLARSPAVQEMQRFGSELVRRNRGGGGS